MSRRIDVPLASDLLFSLLQFRVVLLLVIWVMCEVVGIFGSETFGGGDLVHAFDVHVLGLRLLVCTAILIYFLLRVMLGSVLDRSQVVHRFRLFTVVPLIDVSVVTSWAYCAGQIESFVPMLGYAVIILVTGIFSQRYSLMLVVAFTFVSYTCALFLHPLLGAELSLDAIHHSFSGNTMFLLSLYLLGLVALGFLALRIGFYLGATTELVSMGTLTQMLAHEIRYPLARIVAASDALRLDEEKPEYALIAGECGKIRNVVERMNSFAGKVRIESEEVDLVKVLEDAVIRVRRSRPDKRIKLRRKIHMPHALVEGDAESIEAAFFNILRNSYEAMGDHGAILLEVDAAWPRKVRVRIHDTGYGMDEDTLKHIFTPWETSKRAGQGVGLGMVATKKVIDAHDGTVHVRSRLSEGTMVEISLPLLRKRPIACRDVA